MLVGAVEVVRQQIEAGRGALVDAAGSLPDAVVPLWREAIKEIDAGIKSVEPLRSKVARLWARTELTLPARQEQSREMVLGLHADVQARLDKATRLLGEIARAVEVEVMPARPADATELQIVEAKREAEGILRRRHYGWKATVEGAAELMREAVAAGDALTAYVLTEPGPLGSVYAELLGSERSALRPALYRAVKQARVMPQPSDAFLRLVEAPHDDPNGWPALRVAIENLVGHVGSQAAAEYRQAAIMSPGWGVPSERERLKQQQAAAAAYAQGTAVPSAPEAANLEQRINQGLSQEPVQEVKPQ